MEASCWPTAQHPYGGKLLANSSASLWRQAAGQQLSILMEASCWPTAAHRNLPKGGQLGLLLSILMEASCWQTAQYPYGGKLLANS
jgi:hypothetical protein